MFVYLLIAAELGVLYLVFWYLYIREPKNNQRISADLWGSYRCPEAREQYADPTLPLSGDQGMFEPGLKNAQEQYVLDQCTNRYVKVEYDAGLMRRMAETVDKTLGRLNVRP